MDLDRSNSTSLNEKGYVIFGLRIEERNRIDQVAYSISMASVLSYNVPVFTTQHMLGVCTTGPRTNVRA